MNESLVQSIDITEDEIYQDSLKEVWKTYGYWGFLVSIAFFSVYPTCNWFGATKALTTHHLYCDIELNVPFVPAFYWFYMSLYVLFILPPFFLKVSELKTLGKRIVIATIISGVIFIVFPTSLGFERVVPEGFYANLFNVIFSLDLPHNLVPSLHVVYSAFILIAVAFATQNIFLKGVFISWLGLISLSTLLVHQHHIFDVVSAFFLVWITANYFIKGKYHV